MKKSPVADRMAIVEKRLDKNYGKGNGKKPAPKLKVRPTGNPLKGKFGVQIKKEF